jgi:glycosyltransferase involved in cell wall biosynthesis
MSQDRPQFSVVIPTFNRAKILHRALESVFSQTYQPAEIIVVNDGSADDTSEVLASYGDQIQTINQSNAGLSAARNSGIKAATSEWIVFLDDDDEHVPERLALAAESIALYPEIDVHATNTALVNPDGSEMDLFAFRGKVAGEHMRLEHPLEWVLRGCFFSQAVVVRRNALEEVGWFRKTFYEDMDLFVRLAARGEWAVDGRKSLRLIRLLGEDLNLSSVWRSKPVENYEALVRIHREAIALPNLSESERNFTQSGLATYLFELGCAQLEAQMDGDARVNFQQAAALYPSLHSRIKARALQFGGSTAFAALKRIKPKCGLYRSTEAVTE